MGLRRYTMRMLALVLIGFVGLTLVPPTGADEESDDPKLAGGKAGGALGAAALPPPGSVVTEHALDCEHEALYGGSVVALGNHVAHAEITFDPETSIFTVYFSGADAVEPLRLRQPEMYMRVSVDFLERERVVMLVPKEDDETGEMAGDSSVYWGGTRTLTGALTLGGTIEQIAIDRRTYLAVDFSYPQ
jgi:hypothetical protein